MRIIKSILSFFLFLFLSSSYAQTLTDVARAKEITWYGIDFTQAKFVGFGNTFPTERTAELVKAWSFAPLTEKRKKTLIHYFGKKTILSETNVVESRNSKIDYSSMVSANINRVSIEKINQVVSEYNIKGSGYGVLMIVESLEHTSQFAAVWAVFFNRSTGKLISTHLFTGGTLSTSDFEYRWRNAIKVAVVNMCVNLKDYK